MPRNPRDQDCAGEDFSTSFQQLYHENSDGDSDYSDSSHSSNEADVDVEDKKSIIAIVVDTAKGKKSQIKFKLNESERSQTAADKKFQGDHTIPHALSAKLLKKIVQEPRMFLTDNEAGDKGYMELIFKAFEKVGEFLLPAQRWKERLITEDESFQKEAHSKRKKEIKEKSEKSKKITEDLNQYVEDYTSYAKQAGHYIEELTKALQSVASDNDKGLPGLFKKKPEAPKRIEINTDDISWLGDEVQRGLNAQRSITKKEKVENKAHFIAETYLRLRNEFQKGRSIAFPTKGRRGKADDEGVQLRKIMNLIKVLNKCHQLHQMPYEGSLFKEYFNALRNEIIFKKTKEDRFGLAAILDSKFLSELESAINVIAGLNMQPPRYNFQEVSGEERVRRIKEIFEKFFKVVYQQHDKIIALMAPLLDYNYMLVFDEPKFDISSLPPNATEKERKIFQKIEKKNEKENSEFEKRMEKFGNYVYGKCVDGSSKNEFRLIARNDFEELTRLLSMLFFHFDNLFPAFSQNYGLVENRRELKKQFIKLHVLKKLNWQYHPAIEKVCTEMILQKLAELLLIKTNKESKMSEYLEASDKEKLKACLKSQKISDGTINKVLDSNINYLMKCRRKVVNQYAEAMAISKQFLINVFLERRANVISKEDYVTLIELLILEKGKKKIIEMLIERLGKDELAKMIANTDNKLSLEDVKQKIDSSFAVAKKEADSSQKFILNKLKEEAPKPLLEAVLAPAKMAEEKVIDLLLEASEDRLSETVLFKNLRKQAKIIGGSQPECFFNNHALIIKDLGLKFELNLLKCASKSKDFADNTKMTDYYKKAEYPADTEMLDDYGKSAHSLAGGEQSCSEEQKSLSTSDKVAEGKLKVGGTGKSSKVIQRRLDGGTVATTPSAKNTERKKSRHSKGGAKANDNQEKRVLSRQTTLGSRTIFFGSKYSMLRKRIERPTSQNEETLPSTRKKLKK